MINWAYHYWMDKLKEREVKKVKKTTKKVLYAFVCESQVKGGGSWDANMDDSMIYGSLKEVEENALEAAEDNNQTKVIFKLIPVAKAVYKEPEPKKNVTIVKV